ncbi:ABC transporter permease [Celeribacter indicus]|uniref:Binding-protein-dependent transport systems inner membrane component n=1 Tax=Celeribacter indicus TaxID=1208324 RepID=A0A0B5DXU8_9RHOB|nr:ABC transporter permease [Celeribacter indicus]AJE47824.1 binding-protein-dependent transport systems inner membrane component [Celeribacter indicus]SDW24079.1 peptide/nickel transport system permease protein [Celeribacter indicus]
MIRTDEAGAAIGEDHAIPVPPQVTHSQWRLVWEKFSDHKLALFSAILVICIYLVGLFAPFVAPRSAGFYDPSYSMLAPQPLKFFYRDDAGDLRFGMHVDGYSFERDPNTLRKVFVRDPENRVDVGLFVRGEPYTLLGVIRSDRHLIGPVDASEPFYLLGSDRLGRDVLSRLIFGTQISTSIGLVGVTVSLVLGIVIGGVSGYFGGAIDTAIQRLIEFIISIPTIPLWMGLAAAIPVTWSPVLVYFIVTIIISLIGWTSLAREVRGRFMSWRNEAFVLAARLDGTSEFRVILRHLLPGFVSHIIASVTLAIPVMIIAETSLSFLGIGLRPPIVSWGVLLREAQNIRSLAEAPWLLAPGVMVIVTVLAMNFLGDGLRDAADPYTT